jgi:hypothetical protein
VIAETFREEIFLDLDLLLKNYLLLLLLLYLLMRFESRTGTGRS